MINFLKQKKKITFLTALLVTGVFIASAYAAMERKEIWYKNFQHFMTNIFIEKGCEFGDNAEITSTNKDLYPVNLIKNSKFAIWSGGSRYGDGGTASVPDGWYIPSTSTYTGTTLVAVDSISPVSSTTPQAIHSMYLDTWDSTTGPTAATKFVLYPDSGVSTASWWYKKFAGKTAVFGAWVKRDVTQSVTTGVTTNFIRPVINTYSVHLSGCTSAYWKLGDYVENDGWTLATVTCDVPITADAFECGFSLSPTVLAPTGTSGDSVYVVKPFLLINPLHKEYVPRPDEEIFFTNTVNPFGAYSTGGSTFGTGSGGSLDLSADDGWGGKIPDDVSHIYATVAVNASWPYNLYMYGDEVLGGVSFYTTGSGASPQATTAWIPVDVGGEINISNPSTNFSGVSLFVHGAKIR